ncbi:ATP-binding protein [Gemmobacter serpentinus]|uniref:ATP-binding protein n=1 Tax=Gemmobacter serpentinus TaxID=2652247 RepID=UPI0018656DE2|nr:ATP-binding protein [Gemmobacter serpentinus]
MMTFPRGGIGAISAEAARRNLAVLIRLRWLAILGQIAAITITHYGLGVDLPRREMAPVIAFLVFLNLFASWRLRNRKPVSDLTVTAELLIDVIALTMLLFLSGGASNPFVTLFILQVILGIVLLPARQALLILVAAIAAHYWLLGNGRPMILPSADHSGHGSHAAGPSFFDLHLQGMFLSFALAACLLAWFVLRITENLRQRDAQIVDLRRQMLEEDHLVRMGLLASGAAHELGTPMTTLAVTLGDWRDLGVPEGPDREADLRRMLVELSRCRRILSEMLQNSGQERAEEMRPVALDSFVLGIAEGWRAEGGILDIRHDSDACNIQIAADPMLAQALRQLFDNAQEAGACRMEVRLSAAPEGGAEICLTDDGPGFPEVVLDRETKPDSAPVRAGGRGLGLFLAVNAMRRLSGTLAISNSSEGGARVVLTMPSLTVGTAS